MSRWIDRAALRLATGRPAAPSHRPEADRAETITRRDAVKLGGSSALALAALGTLGPFAATAAGDPYCFNACAAAAENALDFGLDTSRSDALRPLSVLAGSFGLLVYVADLYANFYAARAQCRTPNCGNPATYPKPVASGGGGVSGSGSNQCASGCCTDADCGFGNVCCSCGVCCLPYLNCQCCGAATA